MTKTRDPRSLSSRQFAGWPFVWGLAALVSVALTGPAARSSAQPLPPDLDTNARVACQMSIEETLWKHRIWPDENPGPKPGFSEVVSWEAVDSKVKETLTRTQALAELWDMHITPAMLQAEIDRQAANSQSPALLQDLWAALGQQPQLVAECLARPALVNRLLEDQFARDPHFSGMEFDPWWSANRRDFAAEELPAGGTYHLPTVRVGAAVDDTWSDTASIPLVTLGRTVWTGSEMIFQGGEQGHRYNPATDTWETMTVIGHPGAVSDFSAVWTGTEMITWGGCTGGTEFCTTWLGGRYNPTDDTWTLTSLVGAPSPRRLHDAVWTGSEMIVWGGCTEDGSGNQNCNIDLNTGGRYDPGVDSWSSVTTAGAPAARTEPELIWTGSRMILWSGTSSPSPGGLYDPTADSWLPISTVNAPDGIRSPLVWTGTEMIAWGGCLDLPFCEIPTDSGGRYNPSSDSWTPVSSTDAPSARVQHSAVWSGGEMIVFGGSSDSFGVLGDGARYEPGTDSWAPLNPAGAPSARRDHQAVWADGEMIVWGGWLPDTSRNGARYDPSADTWTAVSDNDPDSYRESHTAVWTGAEMIIWGGIGDLAIGGLNTGRIYFPATDNWTVTSSSGLSPRFGHSAIWTGEEMIIWGGADPLSGDGARYSPMTGTWTSTSMLGTPPGSRYHTGVWTGTTMIVWGGSTQSNPFGRTGGRYDVATDTWQPVSLTGAPPGRYAGTAVWTGDVMVVWGGVGTTSLLADGGRYDPVSDRWFPVSAANQPVARFVHTAIWNGSEMIVWGGDSGLQTAVPRDDGGKYDPLTDSWEATSLSGAPKERGRHSSVWTGTEMIVWGGCTGGGCRDWLHSGSRYDPNADQWQPTSDAGAPQDRQSHSAVWTGSEMIVWGGFGEGTFHTGGRYVALPIVEESVHVGDLDTGSRDQVTRWLAGLMVTVHDTADNPLTTAVVTVDINNLVSRSCTTTGTGTCVIKLNVPNGIESLTLTVTSITRDGFSYDPALNHDPDGDSDGTTTVIVRPTG